MTPQLLPDLRAAFDILDKPRRRAVQLALCRHALGVWEAYLQREGPLAYVDAVVGLAHSVDSALPRDALASVEAGVDQADVAQRYLEPIAALLISSLPTTRSTMLYRSAVEGAVLDDWLIVSQALSAEEDPARWRTHQATAKSVSGRMCGG